jgi:hypothetical protein
MSLLDAFRALKRETLATQQKTRARTWAEYRKILIRRDNPQQRDADRLVELSVELGLTEQDVELHIAVFERLETNKGLAADGPAAAGEIAKLMKEGIRLRTLINQSRYKLEHEIDPAHDQAMTRSGQADSAATMISEMEARFPALLLGDDTAEAEVVEILRKHGDPMTQRLRALGHYSVPKPE